MIKRKGPGKKVDPNAQDGRVQLDIAASARSVTRLVDISEHRTLESRVPSAR